MMLFVLDMSIFSQLAVSIALLTQITDLTRVLFLVLKGPVLIFNGLL